jgi:hypothetical protein
MPRYQIEFNHGGNRKSWEYFEVMDCLQAAHQKAVERANDCLKNRKSGATWWGPFLKSPRSLMVREYDDKKKAPLRGGQRFKLHLMHIQVTFTSGKKEREEWYEYND